MSKSDKELTTEIVCAYLNAWSGQGKEPTKFNGLAPLIEMVYKTIHNLPSDTTQTDDSGE